MTDDTEQTPSNTGNSNAGAWGSDIIAEALREQDIPYGVIVPGASFRGLHDSLVNHLGNQAPRMLLCLHEEHTLSIAHGWAQVTNEPLAAILHTNVGLMHATMTMFNVWCDRMPALVLGASGPHDAEKRRPWIDWIHSATDLGALVRDYTKWDDAPGSAAATVDAIRRGGMIARTSPMGPVYINMDIAVQEEWVEQRPRFHDLSNYRPSAPPAPPPTDVTRAFEMLRDASAPVILVGRVTRDLDAWAQRVRLAEMFDAPVYSIYNAGGGFPKSHPLHHGVVQLTLDDQARDELARADVVLALDWTDLGGTVEQVWPRGAELPAIINVSDDFHLHRGWSMDYHRLQPAALRIGTAPEPLVSSLLAKAEEADLPPGPTPRPRRAHGTTTRRLRDRSACATWPRSSTS